MNKPIVVEVEYKQDFMGETITSEYTTTINDFSDMFKIEEGLYSDPHVYSVSIDILGEK